MLTHLTSGQLNLGNNQVNGLAKSAKMNILAAEEKSVCGKNTQNITYMQSFPVFLLFILTSAFFYFKIELNPVGNRLQDRKPRCFLIRESYSLIRPSLHALSFGVLFL